jgi:hypothetical protein
MHRARVFTGVLASSWVALFVIACQNEPTAPAGTEAANPPGLTLAADDAGLAQMLDDINIELAAAGAKYRAVKVETIAAEEMGQTIFWRDVGNKQLDFDFVPGDVRRTTADPDGWSLDPDQITYAVDNVDNVPVTGTPSGAETEGEIDDAMATWDDMRCSNLGLTEVEDPGDIGVIANIFFGAGSPIVVADVQHAGWAEVEFGGTTIAATFTFGYCDPCGPGDPVWTDVDSNGKNDAAFREIYYDAFCQGCNNPDFWDWVVDDDVNTPGVLDIDIETVALHEAGHGLSQAHFGKGFVTNSNGKLHQAPRSVMQAAYVGPQRSLRAPDNGGHCSIWGSWPQN